MIRLRLPPAVDYGDRFPDDVDRMERVLAEAGYVASRADIAGAWERHSEGSCASWLSLDDDEDADLRLLSTLKDILVVE